MDVVELTAKVKREIDEILVAGAFEDKSGYQVGKEVIDYIIKLDSPTSNWSYEVYQDYFDTYTNAGYDITVNTALARLSDANTIQYFDTMVRQLPANVTEMYGEAIRRVRPLIKAGAVTREQAVQGILQSQSWKGTFVYDSSRRRWKIDTILRRHIRDEMRNASRTLADNIMEQMATDLYVVTSHPKPRPKCALNENWIISKDGRDIVDRNGTKLRTHTISETTFGESDGLYGINCRHSKLPIKEGRTIIRKNIMETNVKRLEMESKRYNAKYGG